MSIIRESENLQARARVEENHPVYTLLLHLSVWLTWPVMAACLFFPAVDLFARGWAWALPLLLLLGILLSDFTSGLFHWFFDNYGSPQTPVFGPTIELFRVHHDLPEDICHSNLVFTVGHVCIWILPMGLGMGGLWAVLPKSLFTDLGLIFAATAALFLVLTNLFHQWAHRPQKPIWMLFLQQKRLILETQHHQVHHTPPFAKYYCITTGWMNPFLHKIQFFHRLEQFLARLGIAKSADV